MKKNWNHLVLAYLATGLAIGAVVTAVALVINFGLSDELKGLIVWLTASALFGLLSLVYECERLSDLTATLIHCPCTIAVALVSGWICGYGDGSVSLLLARMLPCILVLYILIHAFLFVLRRIEVKNLNRKLNGK